MRIAAAALLLAGCESFEQPYVQEPHLHTVTVSIVWHDNLESLRAACKNPQAYACASVGTKNLPYSVIHSLRPRSFSDPINEFLGHELQHALGGIHE